MIWVNSLFLFLYGWESALTFQQTKCEIIKKVPQKGQKRKGWRGVKHCDYTKAGLF